MPDSTYEDKAGYGALFQNNKRPDKNDADVSGYVIADRDFKAGDKIELLGWAKISAKDTPYTSISIKRPI